MKKITFITMQLHTPGGIERFIATLSTMLNKEYEIEIIANYGRPEDSLAFPLPNNIKPTFLTPIQPKEISMKNILFSFKWHKIPAELKRRYHITTTQKKAFKKCLNSLKTDYIITDRTPYNKIISKYYHGPAIKIATEHNSLQSDHQYVTKLLKSIKGFDYLVSPLKELQSFYATKTKVKCVFIPNALASIPTKKSPLTSKNILSVGRLEPEKDYSLLINSMKIVQEQSKDIHLTIIGDGKEKNNLISQIKKLNLTQNITMTGWLSQDEIKKYYFNSSLFVSTSKTEAFGLALTEAMSYGLPCLALSRATGARAQITRETGILINNPEPQKIANQIIVLLKNPDKLKKFQSNINKTISNYSAKTIKKFWLKILH